MDGKRTDTTKHDHATDYLIKNARIPPGQPQLQHLVVCRQNNNDGDDDDNNNEIISKT